jgi:nucleotide-binding universal stress UspA family protein
MTFPFKMILCPIDFDENSEMALDKAVEIARHFDSGLILVHVLPLVLTLGEVPPPAALYEDRAKAARAKLAEIAKKKLAGLRNELHVYTGDVIGSILHAQSKHQCDLLVMAKPTGAADLRGCSSAASRQRLCVKRVVRF